MREDFEVATGDDDDDEDDEDDDDIDNDDVLACTEDSLLPAPTFCPPSLVETDWRGKNSNTRRPRNNDSKIGKPELVAKKSCASLEPTRGNSFNIRVKDYTIYNI